MKYLSVCSGIEAASVAWKGLGWKAAGFSEIEKFPCEVLKYHFPTVPNFGDLTKHENWKIERGAIDVICGGTPCQSFSVAGLRAGMADPRGNLALTFLSLCDRLRPEWIVWENVPGVLSSNGGRDLGAFLGALGQLGYGTAYRILDAQYFGVAQRRRRIFVVANLTDWRRAAAVLFEPESLRGDSAPIRNEANQKPGPSKEYSEIPESGNRLDGSGSVATFWNGADISQTLDAVLYKRQAMPEKNRFPAVIVPAWIEKKDELEDYICQIHGEYAADCACPRIEDLAEFEIWPFAPSAIRYLTPTECERLQGFPDGWTAIPFRGKPASDGPRYKAIGNSMAVPVMKWIGERIAIVDKATKGEG